MFALARPFRVTLAFAALASTLVLADSSHEHRTPNHAHRHIVLNSTEPTNPIQKRFGNARFTFYDAGINACGSFDQPNDFIVALNIPQWDNGAHCYAEITVSYLGKSAKAKITDQCPECPSGALDLSKGLFKFLVPGGFDQGVAYGNWEFGGGDDAPPKPKTTTTKHTPPPTTSHTSTTHKTTSTTSSSTRSTTTSHSTTSTSTTSTTTTSTTSTSTSSAPTTTTTVWDSGTLNQLNLALIGLAELGNAAMANGLE